MGLNHNTPLSFSKKLRLLDAKDYARVFQNPYKVSSGLFVLLYRSNNLPYSRLGLVISKRRLGLSVQRNRVKRLIRESFRLHQKELIGFDVVVLANKQSAFVSNAELYERLSKKWQKMKRFQKK